MGEGLTTLGNYKWERRRRYQGGGRGTENVFDAGHSRSTDGQSIIQIRIYDVAKYSFLVLNPCTNSLLMDLSNITLPPNRGWKMKSTQGHFN